MADVQEQVARVPDQVLSPQEQLAEYVNAEGATEKNCQPFLSLAARLLVTAPLAVAAVHVREQAMAVGFSDYFVVCDEPNARHQTRRKIWLWECKAPQHYQFVIDNRNRLCPSDELFYAENQLLTYHNQLTNDDTFLRRWEIRDHSDVMLGGIIIGRDNRLVKPSRDYQISEEELAGLYDEAVRIRDKYFYRSHSMRMLTWDQILRHIQPREADQLVQG